MNKSNVYSLYAYFYILCMYTYINFSIHVIHIEVISSPVKIHSASSGKTPIGSEIILLGRVRNQSSLVPCWRLLRGSCFLGIGHDDFISGTLPIQGPASYFWPWHLDSLASILLQWKLNPNNFVWSVTMTISTCTQSLILALSPRRMGQEV